MYLLPVSLSLHILSTVLLHPPLFPDGFTSRLTSLMWHIVIFSCQTRRAKCAADCSLCIRLIMSFTLATRRDVAQSQSLANCN